MGKKLKDIFIPKISIEQITNELLLKKLDSNIKHCLIILSQMEI
jgi:hypothetical protein